jgi:hypothetical protein
MKPFNPAAPMTTDGSEPSDLLRVAVTFPRMAKVVR